MNWRDKIRDPDCELCALHESAEHVCLMGSGTKGSEVMIVGEAPGEREDDEHRAFVGPAGRLLDEMLKGAGIQRADCYITNAAKCRPPRNRTPTRGELKTCASTYLQKEMEKVRPDLTLLLGNSALLAVAGKSGITKHRGKLYPNRLAPGLSTFATYHPAAILRNPRLAAELEADIQRFSRLVRGEKAEISTKVKIVRTVPQLKWLRRQLMNAEVISFDIETFVDVNKVDKKRKYNLEDWHGNRSKIVSIGFAWRPAEAVVVPIDHAKTPWRDPSIVLRYLKPCLERRECKYVAHNGKFDCRWLARKGIFVPQTFDTMLAAHILDENRSKGLKVLSQVILGADAYDVGDELADGYHMNLKRLCIYNGKDCDYTLRLYHVFKGQFKQEPRLARIFIKLMMPASNMLTKVERSGIYIDDEQHTRAWNVATKNRYKVEQFLKKYHPVVEFSHGTEGTTNEGPAAINYNSPKQLASWLFDYLDLPVIELTAKGARSTKESVMLRLAKKHPAPAALLKWRKWYKYKSTYLYPWKEYRDTNSRIHPTYKLFGTVTGRLSCVDPNLQQVPRDKLLRGVFGAAPGWTFVEADYSQVELRIAAMLSSERRMLRKFLTGEDIHLATAVDLTRKRPEDVEAEERKMAKAVNFGFVYGMGAKKFQSYAFDNYDVEVTIAEAQEYRDGFFEAYPELIPWHDRQRRLAERYHRVQSPLGRVRHLPDVLSGDKEVRAEAFRQAINSPVQSTASDLMLVSALRLDASWRGDVARIVGSIHDALLFEVREGYEDEILPKIKETMEDMSLVKRWFGADITVPIVADLKLGKHWGRCEPWNGS